MFGWQAAGPRRSCSGEPVPHPETIATAIRIGNPAAGTPPSRRATNRVARSGRSPTRQILDAYRLLASLEGVFVEPASAASVAGLIQARPTQGLLERDEVVVCTVTGHGLKDPNRAIAEIDEGVTVDAEADAVLDALGL